MTSDQSPFPLLGKELRESVHAALPTLRGIGDVDAGRPARPGKWSPAQVIGHLIDSAANNHQRFVRAQESSALTFPPYAQDHWVAAQRYDRRPWNDLVSFWHAYNQHLAHVIEQIPEDRRAVPITIGTDPSVTLGFLVHDYIVHMNHHLEQLRQR
jgi:hypothetical protein